MKCDASFQALNNINNCLHVKVIMLSVTSEELLNIIDQLSFQPFPPLQYPSKTLLLQWGVCLQNEWIQFAKLKRSNSCWHFQLRSTWSLRLQQFVTFEFDLSLVALVHCLQNDFCFPDNSTFDRTSLLLYSGYLRFNLPHISKTVSSPLLPPSPSLRSSSVNSRWTHHADWECSSHH